MDQTPPTEPYIAGAGPTNTEMFGPVRNDFVQQPVPYVIGPDQVSQSIIGSYDLTWIKNYGYANFHPDALFAQKGWDQIDEMRTIAAYTAPLNILKNAILFKMTQTGYAKPPPQLDPGSNDWRLASDRAKMLEWHMNNITSPRTGKTQSFRIVLGEVLEAVHSGFSLMEKTWRYIDRGPANQQGQWGFAYFSYKRCKQIAFQMDPISHEVITINNYPAAYTMQQRGIPVGKTVLYTFRPVDGLPYGRGYARECYKHVWMLQNLYRSWAAAIERHGAPFFLVKSPSVDRAIVEQITGVFDNVANGSTATLPEGVEAELVKLESGGLAAFLQAVQFHVEQIVQAILGQQLTTSQGTGKGSYALGAVHQVTQEYVLSEVRRQLEEVVTQQIFRQWHDYNFGPEESHLSPVFSLGDWDVKDRFMLSEAIVPLINSGVLYSQEPFLRDLLGFPPMDPMAKAKLDELAAHELQNKARTDDRQIASLGATDVTEGDT